MKSLPGTELNPLAIAVAAGCTALLVPMLIALPMWGFGGMMGGGVGWMPGYGHSMGFGAIWLGAAIVDGFARLVFAWICNAVCAQRTAGDNSDEQVPRLPVAR